MDEKQSVAGSSKEETIGFHKGALSTLVKEREEMMKILSIVEQLMQMHVKALKELGVDLVAQARGAQEQKGTGNAQQKSNTDKLDELIKRNR